MAEPTNRIATPTAQAPPDAEQQIKRLTRRSFATGGMATLAGAAGLWWVKSARLDHGVPGPLRRVLEFNERISQAYFSHSRLAPTFDRALAREPRVNGRLGLDEAINLDHWRLDVLGPGQRRDDSRSFPIQAIRELPRIEMVAEFKCVEGWSQIVHWAGARLADFLAKYGYDMPFLSLQTPDRGYYVGLDRDSALHSQSLLAYEMNGQPLTPDHGAPLRLVCPLKYGVKSIKRIGTIEFVNHRPADYWAERGYDWYLGH